MLALILSNFPPWSSDAQGSHALTSDNGLESTQIPTAYARCQEESIALDGHSPHLCIAALRDVIVQRLSDAYKKDKAAKSTASAKTKASSSDSPAAVSTPATLPPIGPPPAEGGPPVPIPVAPHPSDQVTPSSRSPREAGSSSVDQLRSSLRQVADALAQTVAAVRTTREQLREVSEEREVLSELEALSEMEVAEESREDETAALMMGSPPLSLPSTALTSGETNASDVQTISTSVPASVGPTLIQSTTSSSPQPHSSSLPLLLSAFDGSQESAAAMLASTNPNDPLHTFLSAIVRAPPPPLLSLSPARSAPLSQGTAIPVTSATNNTTSSSSRLPVFTQFHQQSESSNDTTNLETHSGPTMEVTPASIPTSVIQGPRGASLHSASENDASTSSSQMMSVSTHPHNVSLRSSTQEIADARTSNLAVELARVVSQLIPNPSSPGASVTASLSSAPQLSSQPPPPPVHASGSGAGGSAIHSPSPSDTLAPLLMTSLQMPVSSVSCASNSSNSGAMDVTEAGAVDATPGMNTCTTTTTTLSTATEEIRVPPSQAAAVEYDEATERPDSSELRQQWHLAATDYAQMLPRGISRSTLEVVYQNHYRRSQQNHHHSDEQSGEQQQTQGQPATTTTTTTVTASAAAATLASLVSSSPLHTAVPPSGGDAVRGGEDSDAVSSVGGHLIPVTSSSPASAGTPLPPPPLILTTTTTSVTSTPTPTTSASQAQAVASLTPIDPTFLAALPESIRLEVVAQHEREQRLIRARQETSFSSSISPEFLAALPPNIQEEVMLLYVVFVDENADSVGVVLGG